MRVIFNSHSVTTLKKEISKTNIKGYSKMKKAEIVNLMMKHEDKFSHIKINEKKSAPKKTAPRKKIVMTSFPKSKGKQRVPNQEPAPATLQQAVGSRPKPKPKKKKKLVIIKKPEPPKPKPQKKDKKTSLLEKEAPKLYKILTEEFFKNKKTMGRDKAFALFKQKINKEYENILKKKKREKEIKETEANIKKQELPELMAIAGLTKAEANKLDPAELFGLLPKELAQIVLNPKETGIKVAQNTFSNESLYNSVKEILKIKFPKIKIDSEKGRLEGNKIYNDLLSSINFRRKRTNRSDWLKIKEREPTKFTNLRKALETPTQVKILLREIERQKLNAKILNEANNSKLRLTKKIKEDIRNKYEGKKLFIVGYSDFDPDLPTYEIVMHDLKKNNHKDLHFIVYEDGIDVSADTDFKMSYKEFILREKKGLIYESKAKTDATK